MISSRLVAAVRRPVLASVAAATVATGLLAGGGAALGPSGSALVSDETSDTTAAPVTDTTLTSVTMVQANLKSGEPIPKFQADVRKVLAQGPDFITYNEVRERQDGVLAPTGYELFRTPGRYTGETPVAWNTSRWTAVATGTAMVSNQHGKTAKQTVEWGMRYANWVTVVNAAGQEMSVISAHLAPPSPRTNALLAPSLRRLGALAQTLSQYGPVLMGGDFNVAYDSGRYPRDLLAELGFTPTYDILGSAMPTGDHHGNTIDYVFMRSATQFSVLDTVSRELNSDHDAVVAHLQLVGGVSAAAPRVFSPGPVRSNPKGTPAQRHAVRSLELDAINAAPQGAAVHLASGLIRGQAILKSLQRAHNRGVHLQIIAGNTTLNAKLLGLQRLLGTDVMQSDFFVTKPALWSRRFPATALLVSQAGATPALRITTDQVMGPRGMRARETARVRTTKTAYDQLFTRYLAAVGRSI